MSLVRQKYSCCLIAMALLLAGAANAQTPVRKAVAANSHHRSLGVGDQVTYRVLEDKDPPVQLMVTDTGELDIPYLGRVRVVGQSTSEVKRKVKKALEKDYYYTATVQLAIDTVAVHGNDSIGKVYLSGKIRVPGPQDLLAGEQATVGKVILRAGGLGEFADSRKVKIIRKSKSGKKAKTIIVDLKEVLERGNIDQDVEIYDGDLIIVPQKMINW